MSISGHHEETWQPAWGVRTALVAIRSFMDTDAKGQLGGIECTKEARQKMAEDSGAWKCPACAKSNADIMKETEALVQEIEDKEGKRKEDEIPQELRLTYRDELQSKGEPSGDVEKGKAKSVHMSSENASSAPPSIPAPAASNSNIVPTTSPATPIRSTQTHQATAVHQPAQPIPDRSLALIDTFIYGVVAALLFMVLKKFV